MQRIARIYHNHQLFTFVIVSAVVCISLSVYMYENQGWRWKQFGSVGAILSGSGAVVAAVAAYSTIREMERGRVEGNRPHVLVNFKTKIGKGYSTHQVYLSIGNYGKFPATQVSFNFFPELLNSNKENIGNRPEFAETISMLPPTIGENTIDVWFDDYDRLFRGADSYLYFRRMIRTDYDVNIEYRDPSNGNKLMQSQQTIGLAYLAPFTRTDTSLEDDWSSAISKMHIDVLQFLQYNGVSCAKDLFKYRCFIDASRARGWEPLCVPNGNKEFRATLEKSGTSDCLIEINHESPDFALAFALQKAIIVDMENPNQQATSISTQNQRQPSPHEAISRIRRRQESERRKRSKTRRRLKPA